MIKTSSQGRMNDGPGSWDDETFNVMYPIY